MTPASVAPRQLGLLGSLACVTFVLFTVPSPVEATVTKSLKPARESSRAVVFDLDRVKGPQIVSAEVSLRASQPRLHRWLERQDRPRLKAKREARRRLERSLRIGRVRAAADRSALLRLAKPSFARGGRLQVKLRPTTEPAPAGGVCFVDPATLTANGCAPTINDTGADPDPTSIWGKTDCEDASRHQLIAGGADHHPAAVGGAQADDAFRRLTVFDGDDVWGERCELGLNDHTSGPTAIFREGERWITFSSLRLPEGTYPLDLNMWQVVMQIKQTQPSANGGGEPVLALHASDGRWQVEQSNAAGPSSDAHEVWSIPAETGVWTRFAFDVTYSQYPSQGAIQVYVDLNGDGDALDANEQSPRITSYTLKYETPGGENDGIEPGESIPSHLRFGVYHDSAIPCPSGCAVDVDNVQVVRAG